MMMRLGSAPAALGGAVRRRGSGRRFGRLDGLHGHKGTQVSSVTKRLIRGPLGQDQVAAPRGRDVLPAHACLAKDGQDVDAAREHEDPLRRHARLLDRAAAGAPRHARRSRSPASTTTRAFGPGDRLMDDPPERARHACGEGRRRARRGDRMGGVALPALRPGLSDTLRGREAGQPLRRRRGAVLGPLLAQGAPHRLAARVVEQLVELRLEAGRAGPVDAQPHAALPPRSGRAPPGRRSDGASGRRARARRSGSARGRRCSPRRRPSRRRRAGTCSSDRSSRARPPRTATSSIAARCERSAATRTPSRPAQVRQGSARTPPAPRRPVRAGPGRSRRPAPGRAFARRPRAR